MSLVHVHRHHNSGIPASTLTPLASLNIILDEISEHIMAAFILSSATINTITIGLSYPYGIPSISTHGYPFHSNISQSIAYKISKHRILQHWNDQNLTHTSDWEEIDPKLFKQSRETTTAHMEHFIVKCMSNTLPTIIILQQKGQATTNLFPRCEETPKTIQHLYQCTHEGSCSQWKALVDALWKWIEAQNTDPDIVILLADALLYIAVERNDLT